MATWTVTKVTPEAAQNMVIQAGVLVRNFDITNPVEPARSDVVCTTSGDHKITCTPNTSDFFEDVNGAQSGSMEGLHLDSWNCGLGITSIEHTPETLELALGAADIAVDGGVNPRTRYLPRDFKRYTWLGEFVDPEKLLAVVMENVVSTGGLSMTTTKNGKAGTAMTLTPHPSAYTPDKVPMAFYVLQKSGGSDEAARTYTAVTPSGDEDPFDEGWYVLDGDTYRITTDRTVDSNKTYYSLDT